MNILAEVKSFSLRIGDSICSLNKTQTHILILIMHQSIPAAPIPPPPGQLRGICAYLVSPGGGALANLARPGGGAFA